MLLFAALVVRALETTVETTEGKVLERKEENDNNLLYFIMCEKSSKLNRLSFSDLQEEVAATGINAN